MSLVRMKVTLALSAHAGRWRHGERGGEAKRDGAAAKLIIEFQSGGCSSTHRRLPGYAAHYAA